MTGEVPATPMKLSCAILADAAESCRNTVVSPFSLSTALGMAALGARGETLAQLSAVAGTDCEPDAIAARNAETRAALLKAAKSDGIDLELSDSLWTAADCVTLPEYNQKLQKGFGAEVKVFGQAPEAAINRWVSKKTHGLIPSSIGGLPPYTRAVLVDAIYFKARWAVPFDADKTTSQPFFPEPGGQRSARFMNLLSVFPYGRTDKAETVDIPYRGNRFRMRIVLPAHGVSVREMLEGWRRDPSSIPAIGPDGVNSPARLLLSVPKFAFRAASDVAGALRAEGVTDAFDPSRADFSGMIAPGSGPFAITKVSHCATIEMDERGTTASASTGIAFGCSAAQPWERLVINRPFVFFIVGPDNCILFAGAVFNPD